MGPYVVGFDTMGYYVPTVLSWLHGGVNLWSFIATAPLLYVLASGLTLVFGSVTFVFKFLGPILLAFLGLSMFVFAKRGLGWSPKKSIVPALLGTLYFVALRVSWDALREEMALIFFFLILTLIVSGVLKSRKLTWKSYVTFCLALIAVVLSNQVVAVLALGVVLFTVVYKFIRKDRFESTILVILSLPAALLSFAIFYLSPAVPEYRLIFGFPQTTDGWLALFGYSSYPAMLVSEAGFFFYCFLPLLPLAVLGLRRLGNLQLRSWMVLILIAIFIPLVSPSDLRFVMLLTYPLAFFAAEGLSWLKHSNLRHFKRSWYRLGAVYLVAMIAVLSIGFMVLPPENPSPYFKPISASGLNGFIYDIPASMLQNTVSIADCHDTVNALTWLKDNMAANSVLLTHRAFYGWALTIINQKQIIMYEFDSPINPAISAVNQGYKQIFLIWWINGQGWNGQPRVPSTFHEIYQSGKIAIYQYSI
jgi:hypothetical protein